MQQESAHKYLHCVTHMIQSKWGYVLRAVNWMPLSSVFTLLLSLHHQRNVKFWIQFTLYLFVFVSISRKLIKKCVANNSMKHFTLFFIFKIEIKRNSIEKQVKSLQLKPYILDRGRNWMKLIETEADLEIDSFLCSNDRCRQWHLAFIQKLQVNRKMIEQGGSV